MDSIAKKLLQLKAFRIQCYSPFKWANGWHSPIYLDDRKILSYPTVRDFFKLRLAHIIAEKYPDVDVIAGVAINAIAHGILVAEQLNLPFVYVHPDPKDHGLENRIEGDLRPRQRVVIIENQVNVGSNVLKVVEAIRNNGCIVEGVVTLFNYDFKSAKRKIQDVGIELTALSNFDSLLKQVQELNLCSQEDIATLRTWHHAPSKWKKNTNKL